MLEDMKPANVNVSEEILAFMEAQQIFINNQHHMVTTVYPEALNQYYTLRILRAAHQLGQAHYSHRYNNDITDVLTAQDLMIKTYAELLCELSVFAGEK
jgi:hypothetical protein